MLKPPSEERDAVQKAEKAFSRLPPPTPVSPQLLRDLWSKQKRRALVPGAPKLEGYLRPIWASIAFVTCTMACFFIYQNYSGTSPAIYASFTPQKFLGPSPTIRKMELFRAVHLHPSEALDYTISYQTAENSVDIIVYLLRQGQLRRAISSLIPTQKSNGELAFHKNVKDVFDQTDPGALQMGWQKLIIILAPKGTQPSASELWERITAPLSKKPRKWIYLEHEINIGD